MKPLIKSIMPFKRALVMLLLVQLGVPVDFSGVTVANAAPNRSEEMKQRDRNKKQNKGKQKTKRSKKARKAEKKQPRPKKKAKHRTEKRDKRRSERKRTERRTEKRDKRRSERKRTERRTEKRDKHRSERKRTERRTEKRHERRHDRRRTERRTEKRHERRHDRRRTERRTEKRHERRHDRRRTERRTEKRHDRRHERRNYKRRHHVEHRKLRHDWQRYQRRSARRGYRRPIHDNVRWQHRHNRWWDHYLYYTPVRPRFSFRIILPIPYPIYYDRYWSWAEINQAAGALENHSQNFYEQAERELWQNSPWNNEALNAFYDMVEAAQIYNDALDRYSYNYRDTLYELFNLEEKMNEAKVYVNSGYLNRDLVNSFSWIEYHVQQLLWNYRNKY